MDKKEKQSLELQRCEAKSQVGEIYGTICKLKELTKSYNKMYYHWKDRFESADRALAEVDGRLKKVGKQEKKKPLPSDNSGIDLVLNMSKERVDKLIIELEERVKGDEKNGTKTLAE